MKTLAGHTGIVFTVEIDDKAEILYSGSGDKVSNFAS